MAPKIKDTRTPHTWIVRWDDYGNVCESQISYLEHLEIDGVVRHHGVTAPEVLDHKHLADLSVVSEMAENAMVAVNKLTAERDSLIRERDDLTVKLTEMTANRDQIVEFGARAREEAIAAVAERDARIAAIEAAVSERDEALNKAAQDIEAGNVNRNQLVAVLDKRGELIDELQAMIEQLTAALDAANTPELTPTE